MEEKTLATSLSDRHCLSLSSALGGVTGKGFPTVRKMPTFKIFPYRTSKPGLAFTGGIVSSFPTVSSDLAMCTGTSALDAIFNFNHIKLYITLYECVCV